MKANIQFGRIAGIPVQFHWTFLLVLGWIGYSSWHPGWGIDWANMEWLSIWVGLVFLAVLLHELGHALMARRFGIHTERIVLYPIGGGAFLEEMPEEPHREIWIALAGPLVNLLLALLMVPIIWGSSGHQLTDILQFLLDPGGNVVIYDVATWQYLLVVFFVLNALLAIFNLIPAFPLDGGRILRAILSTRWSRLQATRLAALVGMGCAVVLFAVGYHIGDLIFAVGSGLIFILAWAELRVQQRRSRLAEARAGDHLEADFHRLYLHPHQSLQEIQAAVADWHDRPILLLDEWQHPLGVIPKQKLFAPELSAYCQEPLTKLLGPPRWRGLHHDEDLLTAAKQLDDAPFLSFLVFDQYGRILGLLNRQRVEAVMRGKG
jgi:Zn-dependent protease